MRILLVEDEPSAARFIAKGLREAKHAVDVAGDGTAVAEVQQRGPLYALEAHTITATTLESRLTVPAGTRELEQLAAFFNRVLERLGSVLSTQRRFMADASHELRTPVSIMRRNAL